MAQAKAEPKKRHGKGRGKEGITAAMHVEKEEPLQEKPEAKAEGKEGHEYVGGGEKPAPKMTATAGGQATAKNLSVRGGIFIGKVTSAKAPLTVKVEKKIVRYVPKYERYKKDRATVKAHNPPEINAKEGDLVKVGETRKISKTKSFVVLEIIKKGEQK